MRKVMGYFLILCVVLSCAHPIMAAPTDEEEVVLRVCNWEEYID